MFFIENFENSVNFFSFFIYQIIIFIMKLSFENVLYIDKNCWLKWIFWKIGKFAVKAIFMATSVCYRLCCCCCFCWFIKIPPPVFVEVFEHILNTFPKENGNFPRRPSCSSFFCVFLFFVYFSFGIFFVFGRKSPGFGLMMCQDRVFMVGEGGLVFQSQSLTVSPWQQPKRLM